MKRNLLRFATIAAMGGAMAFAQAPAAPATPAQPGAGTPGVHRSFERGQAMRERWMQQLNLSPAQRQQARTIFGQSREATKPLRQELRVNSDNLHAAMKTGDSAKIRQFSTQQGNLLGQMIDARTQAMSKFYAILTPAQRAKADQLHQQMRQRMREKMEQRRATE